MAQPKKKKKKAKRHNVNVGDMVMFYAPNTYQYGMLGEITHVLSNQRVVALCLAPQDEDYENQYIVLETAKPLGTRPSGEERWRYTNHITKVVVRATPLPPKPPKKIIPPKVIETQEELLEHLRSESTDKVVLQIAPEENAS